MADAKKDSDLQQQSYPGHQRLDLHLVLYVHLLPQNSLQMHRLLHHRLFPLKHLNTKIFKKALFQNFTVLKRLHQHFTKPPTYVARENVGLHWAREKVSPERLKIANSRSPDVSTYNQGQKQLTHLSKTCALNVYISGGTKYVHYAKRGPFYGSVSTLLSLIIVFKKLLGDNLSVRYFLYKNLFSLKFEKGYYFIKCKNKIVLLGYTFIRALKAFLPQLFQQ